MLCQEADPFSLAWVDAVGTGTPGSCASRPGGSRCARPSTARHRRVLPLYVADRYEGFDAKPFQDLSEAELEHYIEANVAAVREVVERARPDVALANHLVMGPLILARALGDDVP